MYPNMVLERLWRAASGFDQDLESMLLKNWKGFWFYSFYAFLDYAIYGIAFGVLFPLWNSFHFIKNHFSLIQKHPFRQIWKYNVTVTDLFDFLFLLSHILLVLLLDLYCFSLRLLPSLAAYALCCAPCAIAANQIQWGKFFFLSSRLRMLFAVHLVRSRQIRNTKKNWKCRLSG